jgi:hypothetical protein
MTFPSKLVLEFMILQDLQLKVKDLFCSNSNITFLTNNVGNYVSLAGMMGYAVRKILTLHLHLQTVNSLSFSF